jgi:hypothetical protein
VIRILILRFASLPSPVLQLFVTRELSKDTDLQVYDKMIAMQHNPKFAQYFAPIDGNVAGSGMVTN